MNILITGWTRLGHPLTLYKVDMSKSEHKTIDSVIASYYQMHPSAVRITLDIAL